MDNNGPVQLQMQDEATLQQHEEQERTIRELEVIYSQIFYENMRKQPYTFLCSINPYRKT